MQHLANELRIRIAKVRMKGQPRKVTKDLRTRVRDVEDLLPPNYLEWVIRMEPLWDTEDMRRHIVNVKNGRTSNGHVTQALETVATQYQESLKKLGQMKLFGEAFEAAAVRSA